MILNVSERTDIPAFYSDWFVARLKAGFFDVRNPFYPKQVSRIFVDERLEAIVFCTKNPIPMLPHLDFLMNYPLLFFITITPYGKDVEPYVPSKGYILSAALSLSRKLGKHHVIIRYDPIFISPTYSISFHLKAFESLCFKIAGSIDTVVISFLDFKKNTQKHMLELGILSWNDTMIQEIASGFGEIGLRYGIHIQTCAEKYDLSKYGISSQSCIHDTLIECVTGVYKKHKKASKREHCNCIETVDIGSYNSCPHRCRYCYANYDEGKIRREFQAHDASSSLLIGTLSEDDTIHVRKF